MTASASPSPSATTATSRWATGSPSSTTATAWPRPCATRATARTSWPGDLAGRGSGAYIGPAMAQNSLGIDKAPGDTRVVVAMSGGVDSSVTAGGAQGAGSAVGGDAPTA